MPKIKFHIWSNICRRLNFILKKFIIDIKKKLLIKNWIGKFTFIFLLKIYIKMLEKKNEWRVKREARVKEWNKNWSIVRKVIVSCVSRWLGCKWYLGQAPWSLSSSSSHVTLYLWLVEHEMKNEIPHGKFYQIYLNLCIIKLKKKIILEE